MILFLVQQIYIFFNAKHIDILNLYHLSARTKLSAIIYKICNQNGKVYVKLDANEKKLDELLNRPTVRKSVRNIISDIAIRYIDIISAETETISKKVEKIFPATVGKIIIIPNAVYRRSIEHSAGFAKFSDKQNIIVSVGFLDRKNIDMLLEAISSIPYLHDWNIVLIGPAGGKLKSKHAGLKESHPDIFNRVHFVGEVRDRAILYEWYKVAKVFILTSQSEGFPLVFVEAAFFGDYIVSTDVGVARDFVEKQGIGKVIPVGDRDGLASVLRSIIENDGWYSPALFETIAECGRNYVWDDVLKTLVSRIKVSL